MFVGVEAKKPPVLGNIHLVGVHPVEICITPLEAVLEDVGHRDEPDRSVLYTQGV